MDPTEELGRPDSNDRPLIHVVDDDDSFRSALLRLLEAGGFEARGYSSAGDFLLQTIPDRPGCIVLDIHMPGPSGLDLQEGLAAHGVALPVIFLTGHPSVAGSVRAMKAGAVDFLTKPLERADLFEAINRAVSRDAARRNLRLEEASLRTRMQSLTPRERAVFDRLVNGELNKQVAAELGIAERTVKAERARLMDKLGVASVAELGALAERLRWLEHRSRDGPDGAP